MTGRKPHQETVFTEHFKVGICSYCIYKHFWAHHLKWAYIIIPKQCRVSSLAMNKLLRTKFCLGVNLTFKITAPESSVDKRKEVSVLRWIKEENYCGRTLLFGNWGLKLKGCDAKYQFHRITALEIEEREKQCCEKIIEVKRKKWWGFLWDEHLWITSRNEAEIKFGFFCNNEYRNWVLSVPGFAIIFKVLYIPFFLYVCMSKHLSICILFTFVSVSVCIYFLFVQQVIFNLKKSGEYYWDTLMNTWAESHLRISRRRDACPTYDNTTHVIIKATSNPTTHCFHHSVQSPTQVSSHPPC